MNLSLTFKHVLLFFVFLVGFLHKQSVAQLNPMSDYYFLGEAQNGYVILIQKNEKTAREHVIVYDYLKKTFKDIHRIQSVKSQAISEEYGDYILVSKDIHHHENNFYVLSEWYAYWFEEFKLRKKTRIRFDDYIFPTHISRFNENEVLIGGHDSSFTNHFWRSNKQGILFHYKNPPQLGEIKKIISLKNSIIAICQKGVLQFENNMVKTVFLPEKANHDIHHGFLHKGKVMLFVMQNEPLYKPDLLLTLDTKTWQIESQRETPSDFINHPIGIDQQGRVWFSKDEKLLYDLNGKQILSRYSSKKIEKTESFFENKRLNFLVTNHGILLNEEQTLTLFPFKDVE